MKKLCWFAVSFGAALLLFCAVAFTCILLSAVGGDRVPDRKNEPVTAANKQETLCLLAVYRGQKSVLACKLDITPSDGTIETDTVNLAEILDRDPAEILVSEGLYPFIGKCLKALGEEQRKFVMLNSENFVKIADICGGMVYNIKNGSEILLTGGQADSILDCDRFTDFCTQAARTALDGGIDRLFSYISDNTRNNLSYPALYSAFAY